MKISQRGIDAIKRHEGARLNAYLDVAGIPTIGVGHTQGVELGQQITQAQADEFLRSDLAWVEQCIAETVQVSLTQQQYDALCSLIFNIGAGAFKGSTLLRHLNAGDYSGAADEFLRWNKARVNGVMTVVPGLASRRAVERSMFLEADPIVQLGPERPDLDNYPQPIPKESKMPIPAIVAAVLPSIIEAIPKLGGLFGSGSKVAERNVKAAEMAVEIVQAATGAVNAQEAAEKVTSDPAARAVAEKAIESHWFELVEGGGGGIDGARKADKEWSAGGGFWTSPSFWVAMVLVPLVYLIVGAVVGLFGAPFGEDVRAAIANGIVGMVIGALAGYYFGQTTSRNRAPS